MAHGLEIAGLAIIAVALAYVLIPAVLYELRTARTPRNVVCPENHETVLVSLDPRKAVRALIVAEPPCVVSCSRWPDKAGCDRACQGSI